MTAAPKISIASRHEAATSEAIVAALRPGLGTLRLLERAGHYIQAERPNELAALITSFLGEHLDA
jgi:pimeloyl-ACP methyl ester carboxylesterase